MELFQIRPIRPRLLTGSASARYSLLTLLIVLSEVFLNLSLLPGAFAANVMLLNGNVVGMVNAVKTANLSGVPGDIQLPVGGTNTFSTTTYNGSQSNALPANLVGQL